MHNETPQIDARNSQWLGEDAYRLAFGPKAKVSRSLRRFLDSVAKGQLLTQVFASMQGYSAVQLKAIHAYAQNRHDAHLQELSRLGVTFVETLHDEAFGLVSNVYQLAVPVQGCSLAQLNDAVKAVAVLADAMEAYRASPAKAAGFEDYHYRNLPCNIASDEELWCVSGQDRRTGSGGVLEWCYHEEDAAYVLSRMARFPDRFVRLEAAPFCASLA